jgi:hypothetical protein
MRRWTILLVGAMLACSATLADAGELRARRAARVAAAEPPLRQPISLASGSAPSRGPLFIAPRSSPGTNPLVTPHPQFEELPRAGAVEPGAATEPAGESVPPAGPAGILIEGPASFGSPSPGVLSDGPPPAESIGPGKAVPVRYPTHAEFAKSFQPLPGNYEVVLLHPYTCQPVKLCFTLPNCRLKKVRVERGELEYDYGDVEVELRFKRDGRARVEYND